MKDYKFGIKVSDLLHNPGTHDSIHFVNKFSTFLPHLHSEGMTIDFRLLGLDDKTLLCVIDSGNAVFDQSCDRCGQRFLQELSLPYEEIKCYLEGTYEGDDEYIMIGKKDLSIDLEKMFTDIFYLQQPVIHLCTDCQLMSNSFGGESEEIPGTIERK